jgi:hypothetical protein
MEAGDTGSDRHEEQAGGELGGTGIADGIGARTGIDTGGGLGAWGVSDYRDLDSYWRRRFFILAAGFVILCGLTWALSALLGPARSIQVGGSADARSVLPARGKPSPVGYGPTSGAMAASVSEAPSAPGKGAAPDQRRPSRAGGRALPAACPPASIVLSLLTSQARYGQGQEPQFEVYAVSTAHGACNLAFSPSAVRVMVTSQGHVVWDSAACGSGGVASARGPVRFRPGVPRVATVTWSRRAGTAGCAGPAGARAGAAGTYEVLATTDGESSPVRTFTLSR